MLWKIAQDKVRRTKYKVKDLLLCILSAGLLIFAFPNFNIWLFAWFGFVPLFFAIEGKSKAKAFLLSYITGVIFWLGTIYWLIHVTLPGLVLLVLYLALFFGFFGLIISSNLQLSTYFLVLSPAVWVLLEYIRSHLFTGFPWALLGHSQYLNLPAIQIADITGAWGVSFLVMLVNAAIYEVTSAKKKYLLPILLLLITLIYGYYKLHNLPLAPCPLQLRISVIQGNIPQELKWDPAARLPIIDKYLDLSRKALKDKPDLIIWPEAAIPVVLEEEPFYLEFVRKFAKDMRTPLLIGAVSTQGGLYYNTAILISGEGKLANRYAKIHLVPFGEYIPLRKILPFLETVVPIGDFAAGKEYTVFTKDAVRFSVLICFEDLFPELSREFVKKGAGFLVNITNDAWFGKTSSPYQHLSASVLRAVENRVALVRAANTGVSGFIAPTGEIISLVSAKEAGEIFVGGFKTQEIKFPEKSLSFYSRFGDLFIFVCILLIFYVIIALPKKKR